MPIGLFCGKGDHFVAPQDYIWLRDELSKENNCKYFKEYDLGHLGLVIPKEKTIFLDMLALLQNVVGPEKIELPQTNCSDLFKSSQVEVQHILSLMSKHSV